MILVIDNYDSFTYNLVHYLAEEGAEVVVRRNDAIDLANVDSLQPEAILISPGPGTPDEAGITLSLIAALAGRIPLLGVCLGHQAIAQAFGGKVVRAPRLMHGRTSPVIHDGQGVFLGLPSPFVATRYHSLIVERESLPSVLLESAWTEERELMGLRHRQHDVEGVQFHPESFLTEHGHAMIANFIARLPERGKRPQRSAA